MFESVLIANRGEIAVRVIRTLRELGIRSIAVYSDADVSSRHVLEADEAIRIGPAPAAASYLSIPAILEAARATGAQAIHPGYGFLSENPAFAEACAAAGIVFIGPPVTAIQGMGDQIAATTRDAAAGVPVVPGRHDVDMTDEDVRAAVAEIGFPAMLKPSAGGGGKGMRVVREGADVGAEISAARREATKSFGDDRLLVERYIERPRHIEVQVLADQHGTVIHLGERECSLQRRHQKVIEEAPSPFVTPAVRERLGAAAIDAARSCGYVGAGTVEFIVDGSDPESFYVLEMNTRLQVEHPVTELVTGWDLVAWQLRIAAGEHLPTDPVTLCGHAIEARVYAEDPARDFLPSTGQLLLVAEDTSAARVDSGVVTGQVISSNYDPMIAKVISSGADRAEALDRLDVALGQVAYLGVTTNTAFLQRLLQLPSVRAADLHTGLIDDNPDLVLDPDPQEHALASAGLDWLAAQASGGDGAWDAVDGWRLSSPAPAGVALRGPSGSVHMVSLTGDPSAAQVAVAGTDPVAASARVDGSTLITTVAGATRRYRVARHGADVWLSADGHTLRLTEIDRLAAEGGADDAAAVGAIRSPMPGTVIAVSVADGDTVTAGQPLVTVEAMKMEHTLVAPADAVVTQVAAVAGGQVAMDELLVMLEAADE